MQVHAARVVTVESDSPAAETGLRPNDLIVAVDDIPVANADVIIRSLDASRIDRTLLMMSCAALS